MILRDDPFRTTLNFGHKGHILDFLGSKVSLS